MAGSQAAMAQQIQFDTDWHVARIALGRCGLHLLRDGVPLAVGQGHQGKFCGIARKGLRPSLG
jgi:hypothetical protein